jgi:2-methylcitrate dehydratase PrpD
VTTLEKFAKTLTQIDYELAEAGEQQSIENHILDTVGATITGAGPRMVSIYFQQLAERKRVSR